MTEGRSIRVPLPARARATEQELEQMEAAFRSIVDLHFGDPRRERAIRAALERDGWHVHDGLVWQVTAQRGHDYEEATGRTREEALALLGRLVSLDSIEGCP